MSIPTPTPTTVLTGHWKATPAGDWIYSAGAHELGSITTSKHTGIMTGLEISGDIRFHDSIDSAAAFIEQECEVDFQGFFQDSALTVALKPGPRPPLP